MEAIKNANLALRFGLELCMLAALAAFGAHLGSARWQQVLLGIGIPSLAALAWGLMVSPKARIKSHWGIQLGVEAALFGLAAIGLFAMGRSVLGTTFVAAAIFSRAIKAAFDTREDAM